MYEQLAITQPEQLSNSLSTPLCAPLPSLQPDELPGDPGELALPSYAIVSMLRREVLLTKAKLHFLVFEHLQQEKAVRMLKVQLRQVSACGGGRIAWGQRGTAWGRGGRAARYWGQG